MDGVVTGVCVAGGLLVGDAAEILVERVGAREPLRRPWTRCPHCGEAQGMLAVVPLLRVAARRRCPHCGEAVAFALRPLVLGMLGGTVLGAMGWRFGADVALAAYAVLGLSLLVISAIDLERFVIPNRLVYPTLATVGVLLVVASAVDHRFGSLARAAIAGALAFVAFLVVHLAVPKGMGFGDVRLAGVIGMATGWLGLGHAFVAFFSAFLLGAVIGIVVMAATGGGRKTRIPFGPFMAAGALITVIWGNPVVNVLFHRGA